MSIRQSKISIIFFLCIVLSFSIFTADSSLKHVFLFIGDGMGEKMVEATELAMAKSPEDKLSFRKFPVLGWQRTASANAEVTDSAAAITAIACGIRTNNGMLGVSPEGKAVESIAEIAHRAGWKIGILSSVSLDHATPAGFYAHDNSRQNMSAIAQSFADSQFEFFGGGGLAGQKGLNETEDNLQRATRNGFNIIRTRKELSMIQKDKKIFAFNHRLANGASLPWAIDTQPDDLRLSEFTEAAIKRLAGSQFFMMVEGGKIDWACHANDLGSAIRETEDFNNAVIVAIKFFEENPENTLIIVTADHETGALSRIEMKDADPKYVLRQKMTGETLSNKIKELISKQADFATVLALVKNEFAISDLCPEEQDDLKKAWALAISGTEDVNLYGKVNPVTAVVCRFLATRAGYKFNSNEHSSKDVPLYAIGYAAENFTGTYNNTEIFTRLATLMKLSVSLSEK
jgi:alkaline phosphatase